MFGRRQPWQPGAREEMLNIDRLALLPRPAPARRGPGLAATCRQTGRCVAKESFILINVFRLFVYTAAIHYGKFHRYTVFVVLVIFFLWEGR